MSLQDFHAWATRQRAANRPVRLLLGGLFVLVVCAGALTTAAAGLAALLGLSVGIVIRLVRIVGGV